MSRAVKRFFLYGVGIAGIAALAVVGYTSYKQLQTDAGKPVKRADLNNYAKRQHGGIESIVSYGPRATDFDGDSLTDQYVLCKDDAVIARLTTKNIVIAGRPSDDWFDIGPQEQVAKLFAEAAAAGVPE